MKNIVDKKYNFIRPLQVNSLKRLGRNADGGYIVDNNLIKKANYLISLGIGNDWSFENDLINKNQEITIHIYDHTVNAGVYIKNILKNLRRFFTFRSNYKALKSSILELLKYKIFLNQKNVNLFREKVVNPTKNNKESDIKKIFSRIDTSKNIILKCDIEGSEYEIISSILNVSKNIDTLLIEFHDLDKNDNIFIESMNHLKEKFNIIHLHGNNHADKLANGLPKIIEITLLNKKYLIDNSLHVNHFPIKDLDFPNNPNKEDLNFSFQD